MLIGDGGYFVTEDQDREMDREGGQQRFELSANPGNDVDDAGIDLDPTANDQFPC